VVGSDVVLRMYGEVGVITFVCEEGGDTGGVVRSVVVCELGKGKE